jgi:iron complex outermembrane receptor protein
VVGLPPCPRRIVRYRIVPGCAFFLAFLCGAALSAAEGAASLAGTISAPDGSRLSGVALTLQSADGSLVVRAASGAMGAYRMAHLPAGRATLIVMLAGFATFRSTLDLAPGESRRLDVRLEIRAVRESVEVLSRDGASSVEAAALRESPARDVGEALDGQAGIVKQRQGALGNDVVLRGLHGADVNVLVDGQRICGACPNRMDPPAFHVDFGEVERIEIARGPFDIKNLGGLGGAINVVTRRPATGWQLQPSVSVASADYVNPALVASYGGRHVSALGGFSYRESRAYRDGSGRRLTDSAGYRAGRDDAFRLGTGWARALYHDAGGILEVAYTRQQADDVLYPALLMDAISDDTDRWRLSWETVRTKTQIGYSLVRHWMTDARRTSAEGTPRGYSMGTDARARTLGGRFEWLHGDVTAGAEAGHRLWNTGTEMAMKGYLPEDSLARATTDNLGAFVQVDHDFTVALGVSAGARLDGAWTKVDGAAGNVDLFEAYHGTRRVEHADVLPAAKLRVTWRPGSSWTVSAGVGHAARVPEPSERYFALQRMGTDWVGNPELAPSRNTGLDVSVRREGARVRLDGSVFLSRVVDAITVAEVGRVSAVAGVMNVRARTWQNVDATLAGGEARATVILSTQLSLDATGAYVRGTQDRDPAHGLNSGNLAEMPPLNGRVGLRYDDGRFWVRAEGVFAARQTRVNADLREEPTAGFGVLNLTAGLRRGRALVTAGVMNALDHFYVEYLSSQRDPFRSGFKVPEPGRQVFVNLHLRLGRLP